jgi:hypothetical protein
VPRASIIRCAISIGSPPRTAYRLVAPPSLPYIGSLLLRTLPQIDADNAAGIKYQPKKLDAAAITDSPEAFECSRPRIRTREDLGYLHSGARPQQETVMTNAEFAR